MILKAMIGSLGAGLYSLGGILVNYFPYNLPIALLGGLLVSLAIILD